MSRDSYLREFCAQVSQRSCFKLIWPFYRLLELYHQKYHKTHISASSVHMYQKSEFQAELTVFTAYYNCMSKNVTKLISPRVLCTSITNRVLRLFDCFTAFYNCMSENITKLISPRILCTSVTNRVLSWFDRFTAYYNCMSKKITKMSHLSNISSFELRENVTKLLWVHTVSQIVFLADLTVWPFYGLLKIVFLTVWVKKYTKLISPRFLCTSIKNRVLREFFAQLSQIIFVYLAHLNV